MEGPTYLHLLILLFLVFAIFSTILHYSMDFSKKAKISAESKSIIPKYRIIKNELLNNRVEFYIEEFYPHKQKWGWLELYEENNKLYKHPNTVHREYKTLRFTTFEEAKAVLEKLIEQKLSEFANTNIKTKEIVLESKSITV